MEGAPRWIYLHSEKPICRQESQSTGKPPSIYFTNPEKRFRISIQKHRLRCKAICGIRLGLDWTVGNSLLLKSKVKYWTFFMKLYSTGIIPVLSTYADSRYWYIICKKVDICWIGLACDNPIKAIWHRRQHPEGTHHICIIEIQNINIRIFAFTFAKKIGNDSFKEIVHSSGLSPTPTGLYPTILTGDDDEY